MKKKNISRNYCLPEKDMFSLFLSDENKNENQWHYELRKYAQYVDALLIVLEGIATDNNYLWLRIDFESF